MARKVSVSLEANVAGFLGPVLESTRATEKLDDKVDELDRSLNKIPADALKAGAAMRLLSGNVKDVGTNFAAVGDKSSAMTILDTRIKNTRAEVRKLGDEFTRTGDIDVFKKLGHASGDLSVLTRFRKDVSNSIENGLKDGVAKGGPEAARTFSSLFQGGIINALKSPPVLAAAVGLAALLAIPIGATIGGAILAAAGAGAAGFAGFAAVQADRNGKIAAAGADLLSKVNNQITTGGMSAIGPLLAGIHQLSAALNDVHLDRIIREAAKYIEPLAAGAARFATYLSQGIEHLVVGGGPAVKVLADELPALGRAVKTAFDAIASGGEGGARALQDTLRAVESFIITTGRIIGFLERAYGALRQFGDGFESVITKIRDFSTVTSVALAPVDALLHIFDTGRSSAQMYAVSLDGAAHGIDGAGQAAKSAEQTLAGLNAKLSQTAITADTLAGSIVDKLIGSMLSLDNANISVADSLDKVTESFKTNGKALDIHTAKGRANRTSVLGAVQANLSLYDAQISAGMSAQDAAAAYDVNTAALERQLRKAGLTKAQIDGLIGKYRSVPKNVNTLIALQGLTDAINGLADLIRLINHIPSNKIVHVTTVFSSTGQMKSGQSRNPGGGLALGGIRHAALGMIVAPSNPGTLIAEPQTGGEALIPLQGLTQHAAMGLMRTAGAGYGLDVVQRSGSGSQAIAVTINFAGSTDSAFATSFMKLVRKGDIQIGVS